MICFTFLVGHPAPQNATCSELSYVRMSYQKLWHNLWVICPTTKYYMFFIIVPAIFVFFPSPNPVVVCIYIVSPIRGWSCMSYYLKFAQVPRSWHWRTPRRADKRNPQDEKIPKCLDLIDCTMISTVSTCELDANNTPMHLNMSPGPEHWV